MSQTQRRRTAGGRGDAREAYNYGSSARKLDHGRAVSRQSDHARAGFRVLQGGRRQEKVSKAATVANLIFMVAALMVMTFALYRYVGVQSSLESSVTTIASLEKELASLKQENDEAYSRANATIDLEEVKRMAIQELGMKYADEGQIVVYSDDGAADYVRQMAEIPEVGK